MVQFTLEATRSVFSIKLSQQGFLFNDIQLATKLEKKATKLFEQLDVAGREIRDTAVNYLKNINGVIYEIFPLLIL